MSDVSTTATAVTATPAAANWPGESPGAVSPPLTQAALLNAAARAAASNSRRDLVEYLRLRRKPA